MRLFVSIDPPAEVAQALARLAALADWPGARPTPADHIHLTCHFIGETSPRELDDVLESVARAAAGLRPFDLTLLSLATLPDAGPVRLVAALADRPPTLLELHRRLVQRLARRPRRPPEGDDFLPHLTLCRFVQPPPDPLRLPALPVPIAFRVEALAIKESRLKPGGAEHRVLRLVGLTGRG